MTTVTATTRINLARWRSGGARQICPRGPFDRSLIKADGQSDTAAHIQMEDGTIEPNPGRDSARAVEQTRTKTTRKLCDQPNFHFFTLLIQESTLMLGNLIVSGKHC